MRRAAILFLSMLMLSGCAHSPKSDSVSWEPSDLPAPSETASEAAEIAAESQPAPEPAADTAQPEPYAAPESFTEQAYADEWTEYAPSDGLTREGGVNAYGGRTETWYSSNVARHYRTDEWTLDEEGFYRTEEGYYVVAASDMPEGTVFEGSKGECIVADSGCADGVTDYYVGW